MRDVNCSVIISNEDTMSQTFAEWTTAQVNDLPDSSFAYIAPGGKKDGEGKTTPRSLRHLPYKDKDGKPDLPHVRNALARLSKTQIPESAKPGIKKKLEAILEKAKASNKYVGLMPFEFDEDGDMSADAKTAIPSMIHLIPMGQWDHDMYGPITINQNDIQEFAQNFNMGIRKGVFITAGHEGMHELPAQGWVTAVEVRPDGLWGTVEWNELGLESLQDKQFKFFSPEFYRDYEDPQTHQIYRNVLTGGALTKSPYFKELQAIVASDSVCFRNNISRFSEDNTMNLTELLAKDITTLSDEEKSFIKANAEQLTDEQKASHASIIEEPEDPAAAPEATPENPEAPASETPAEDPAPAAEPETPAAEPETPADPAEPVAASEKVLISAADLAVLKRQAADGAKAFSDLEAIRLGEAVGALVFSAKNPTGRFLPKSTDNLRAFMQKLNAEQRKSFSELITSLPTATAELFKEQGDGGAADGTARKEVELKVNEAMKANDKLSYGEALKHVMSEHPELATRYDAELNGAA